MSHESLTRGNKHHILARLEEGIASERQQIEARLLDNPDYEVPDAVAVVITRPNRWRIAPWNDAVRALAETPPEGVLRADTPRFYGRGDISFRATVATTDWGILTDEQREAAILRREVTAAEREVGTLHALSDAHAAATARYCEMKEQGAVIVRNGWDWVMDAPDREARGRRHAIVGQVARDLTYINPNTPLADVRYTKETLDKAPGWGDARRLMRLLDAWLEARGTLENSRARAHDLPDEDDEATSRWDCESIPGWFAPQGSSDWLDGITELLARVKANA